MVSKTGFLGGACLAACLAAPAFGQAGQCFFFFNKQEFESFNQTDGKFLKGIEDFEESNILDGAKQVLPAPLQGNQPNVDPVTGFGFPDGLTEKNIIIQDNIFPGPNPPDVNPSGSPLALFVIGPGFIGSNSKKVGEDLEVLTGQPASIDLLFTEPNHTGVGFELSHFAGFGNGDWHVTVYNKNDIEICKIIVPDPGINEPSKVFVGVWTPDTIGRINIWDQGIIPDAIDNIQLWEEQESPCPWDCGLPHNKQVDIIDLLALFAQWGQVGTPCDFGLGNIGVSINDFRKLLIHWGPCPTPVNDECEGAQLITRSDPQETIEVHYDSYGATPSLEPYQCLPGVPPTHKDTWYCLTYQPGPSDIKKLVRVSTSVPQLIEVTAGCFCPPGPLVACGFGMGGTPQFPMQPGDKVTIRLIDSQDLPNDLLKGLLIIENKLVPPSACPASRIDFGVTLDDFGATNACPGPNIITTQYVFTQDIVFGTAVDNFGPPDVAILDDGACSPSCRSSGLPPFTADWWCQFRIGTAPGVPGVLAGVPTFSAEVCFIDATPGTILMEGYNNDRLLVALAANTTNGTEVLTLVAPAGELIAYVRVVSSNPDRPAGLSIDCLSYPDPTERVEVNFYDDPQLFALVLPANKFQKFFWDFKPNDQNGIVGLDDPQDINTHGLDPDDPWTDPSGNNLWPPFVDNVQFVSNAQPQGPLTPQGLDGLAFVPAGIFLDNNALVSNFFVNSFDIISGPPAGDNHTAFALELVSLAGPVPTTLHVTVYDKDDHEMGKINVPYNGGKVFLGIITKDRVTIGRIDIWDPQNGAEGISSIAAFAQNPFGCPGEGPCCQPNGLPGCNNVDCCRRVCAIDPFCCDIAWDQACANEAAQFPQCDCGNPFGCPGKGDCCQPHGTPACNNTDCCRRVCAQDPFCCNVQWDSICAQEALQFPQCNCQPAACPGARIDFGVTLDDFGATNTCPGPNIITTQYVFTQDIVFGTAVDNFGPPDVAILDDGACSPSCRSSGLPAYTADWWCQFRIGTAPGVPGVLAGVTVFSAELCFIDAPPGTIEMEGYNNDRLLIASAATTGPTTETLTITAPPGELIAYVRVVSSNPARPAGLSIDCLSYRDPVPRNPFGCPGKGDCCQPTGLPGCNNTDCCRRVCAIDPFCCDVAWDQACVNEANTFPQCNCGPVDPCLNPNAGPCCTPNGGQGCNNPDCCHRVCAIDPFCCTTAWDSICASEAATFPQCNCGGGCIPPPTCGPGAGDCCVADGTPGCAELDCCCAVCTMDPFCCNVSWDSICAGEATSNPACNEGACFP